MTRLVIVGAGGHGRVVADTAAAIGLWDEIVFLDARFPALDQVVVWPVIGLERDAHALVPGDAAIGIGDAELRLFWMSRLATDGWQFPVLVHPHAWVSPHAQLGDGTVVMAGAVVQVGAEIGRGGVINTGASVDHDVRLGTGVHVAPGARLGGNVEVGDHTWIGIGAAVRQGVRIGHDVMVGAGAAVVGDVPDDVTVVGVPARPLQREQEHG